MGQRLFELSQARRSNFLIAGCACFLAGAFLLAVFAIAQPNNEGLYHNMQSDLSVRYKYNCIERYCSWCDRVHSCEGSFCQKFCGRHCEGIADAFTFDHLCEWCFLATRSGHDEPECKVCFENENSPVGQWPVWGSAGKITGSLFDDQAFRRGEALELLSYGRGFSTEDLEESADGWNGTEVERLSFASESKSHRYECVERYCNWCQERYSCDGYLCQSFCGEKCTGVEDEFTEDDLYDWCVLATKTGDFEPECIRFCLGEKNDIWPREWPGWKRENNIVGVRSPDEDFVRNLCLNKDIFSKVSRKHRPSYDWRKRNATMYGKA